MAASTALLPRIRERRWRKDKETTMEKRLVTQYATKSKEDADENQRRIEGVFAELSASQPDNVS
jgi:hypothetical protein